MKDEPKYKIGDVVIIVNGKKVTAQAVIIRAAFVEKEGKKEKEWMYWMDPNESAWMGEDDIIKKL